MADLCAVLFASLRENGNNNAQWRNDSVAFPFPRYTQTDAQRKNIKFAVNTALNYII